VSHSAEPCGWIDRDRWPILLPEVLPRLRRAYPALSLYLVEDLTGRLVEQLRIGALDVVLLALPREDCRNFEARVLFRDSFKFALARPWTLHG
jgi:LysR family hydrogen peroxide-inducible transcriptional activator